MILFMIICKVLTIISRVQLFIVKGKIENAVEDLKSSNMQVTIYMMDPLRGKFFESYLG